MIVQNEIWSINTSKWVEMYQTQCKNAKRIDHESQGMLQSSLFGSVNRWMFSSNWWEKSQIRMKWSDFVIHLTANSKQSLVVQKCIRLQSSLLVMDQKSNLWKGKKYKLILNFVCFFCLCFMYNLENVEVWQMSTHVMTPKGHGKGNFSV